MKTPSSAAERWGRSRSGIIFRDNFGGSVERNCMYCGADLSACFGHVLARDILPLFEEGIMPYKIREVCAKCIIFVDLGILPRPALDEVSLEYQIDWDLIWLIVERSPYKEAA
ncbi:hypothetical protein KW796_02725 [Candidatus Parcubacteria bacterium]|nr:hypothetical protein [Candidatus Parcubacteria bacterium]